METGRNSLTICGAACQKRPRAALTATTRTTHSTMQSRGDQAGEGAWRGGGGVGAAGAWPWRTTRVACASSRLVNGHSSHMPPPRALGIPPPDPRPCRRRAPPVGVGEGGVVRCGWVSTQWRGTLPNKTGFRFSSSPRPCFCSELFSKAGPSCAPHPGVVHPPTPLVGFCGTSTDLDTNTMSLHTGW